MDSNIESKGVKLLLIDDEPGFTEPMAYWLKSKGYSVLTADSGLDGIKMVKEDKPDIVFLDLNMPVMDGLETLKKIREVNKGVAVIIISAYLDKLRLTEVSRYGVSGVFYKGEEFDKGLSLIQTALKSHKKLKK